MGKARIRVKKQRYGSCGDFSGEHSLILEGNIVWTSVHVSWPNITLFGGTANKIGGRGYIIESRVWRRGRDFVFGKGLKSD